MGKANLLPSAWAGLLSCVLPDLQMHKSVVFYERACSTPSSSAQMNVAISSRRYAYAPFIAAFVDRRGRPIAGRW